ncbi:MAG: carbamoyl-phosphate synthase small subunit [Gammaproteobacteria bacterium]|nr:carbamoyl-phosphate synthase small subunit [Gammaproteobacteria bacterium]NBT44930.1 carbamoyl-phosphate synthase small subunit [Gammaproteobacteria bacterium]NBY23544.1 carbamoyl-phosphate synthase small subunit [Gammaproteobacteria bacterium]NDE34361.1 carbamoyl-phosphate synthase small subunit [Gammaproteobacteria bacterium]NDE56186.1 carbamoyl-phosphate synthase small subunit [Gammaproteobacteria bacterium]
MNTEALLALEDGTLFRGIAIGVDGFAVGEVVFNTSITGYQEILTDPSYARQMVTLTYPHIGNVGVNDEDIESGGLHASGLIVRDVPERLSNWRAQGGLSDYLKDHGVVGIAGIDTRKLTRILRDKGAQRGCIIAGSTLDSERAIAEALAFPGLKGMDLAREVTTSKIYPFHQGSWQLGQGYGEAPAGAYHVVAYDFGIKLNILRLLADRGCRLTVVPATTPAEDVLALQPDGVFLSNGPGDPEPCVYAIEAIRRLLEARIPVFGICLGHQLLGLASGARTMKMKFGHHGANHPVLEIDTGRVLITSQNHGFAVDEASLPPHVRATYRSLFDGSLQGIERTDCLAFSFQGHPEASPGPHDLMPLFDRFMTNMSSARH